MILNFSKILYNLKEGHNHVYTMNTCTQTQFLPDSGRMMEGRRTGVPRNFPNSLEDIRFFLSNFGDKFNRRKGFLSISSALTDNLGFH